MTAILVCGETENEEWVKIRYSKVRWFI